MDTNAVLRPIARLAVRALLVAAIAGAGTAVADEPQGPAALRARYASEQGAVAKTPFGEPLLMQSQQQDERLRGDVFAALPQPFARLRDALDDPASWCDILVLTPNIKQCRVEGGSGAHARDARLDVKFGKVGTSATFAYRVVAVRDDYLAVQLTADEGPLGTRDYDILLEASSLDPQRSVVHLAYSHAYGLRAQLAMQTYFRTLGRGKVGFTVVGRDANGQPQRVGEFRGALERNAMHYYLAIEAYLETRDAPPSERLARSVRRWLDYAERYPRQLHEDPGYVDTKLEDARNGGRRAAHG